MHANRSFKYLAGILLSASASQAQLPAAYAPLDAYVEKAMKDWEVPGAAIAIVKGDSVIYAKGFGVRAIGKPDKVDARTIFAIGSASKAFTGAGVAMLVDEGKIRWDDPVTQHLPGFQMYDAYATRELRVRDILSHRSGLARGDLVWYASSIDRDEILRRVRYLKPSWSLRSNFGYQNIMFVAAGQITATVAKQSWDDFMRDRLFVPLGMTETNTTVREISKLANVATPHARIDDTLRVIAWRNIDNAGPAGSINSNVTDMAKWVQFQLDSGKVGKKSLLTAASFVETHTPHTIIPRNTQARTLNPFTHYVSYGFGWFLEDYRGREVVHHGGNIDGMSALVAMMPEEDLGVVILTNMNGTALTSVLMRKIFDLHLGAPAKDWSADVLKLAKAQEVQAKAVQKKKEEGRAKGTKPSLALAKYVGTYNDSLYGQVNVKMEKDHLVLTSGPGFIGDLEHWHHNTFRANWRDRAIGKFLLAFTLSTAGEVDGLKFEQGPGAIAEEAPDYRKIADPADTVAKVQIAKADLEKFVGSWESTTPPLTLTVDLIGDELKLTVPGQPVYTLVAMTSSRFKLTGPTPMPAGFFVEYSIEGGSAKGMKLEQPAPQPTMNFVRANNVRANK
ncbi:MAG: serine hydrolase [Anaerolineae bacterium]|nr:serine hydrolase [Gemmatimonadaceae bacterium]